MDWELNNTYDVIILILEYSDGVYSRAIKFVPNLKFEEHFNIMFVFGKSSAIWPNVNWLEINELRKWFFYLDPFRNGFCIAQHIFIGKLRQLCLKFFQIRWRVFTFCWLSFRSLAKSRTWATFLWIKFSPHNELIDIRVTCKRRKKRLVFGK